jgi:L-rhamnose mutarotase
MSTYPEVIKQVQKMSISEQFKLFNTLKDFLAQYIEVEDSHEFISQAEIEESEEAWQEYITGKDKGITSRELKKKLLLNQDD